MVYEYNSQLWTLPIVLSLIYNSAQLYRLVRTSQETYRNVFETGFFLRIRMEPT
jgi:hypothetical protein